MVHFGIFVSGVAFGIFVTAMISSIKLNSVEKEWREALTSLNEKYLTIRKKYYLLIENKPNTDDGPDS